MKLFEILTYVGCTIGMLLLFSTFAANGAPQQAAGAAMAVAFCVIPYCITATLQRVAILRLEKERAALEKSAQKPNPS